MEQLEALIQDLIKEEGGTREDYFDLMNRIIYHETGGTMKADTIQYDGGPGRGLFQYELGDKQGAETAVNRLRNYYKSHNKRVPRWVKELDNQSSPDFSKLAGWQQRMLFLGDKKMGSADLSKVFKGEQSPEDFWVKYHWKGDAKDEPARRKSWNTHMENFNEKYGMPNNTKKSPVTDLLNTTDSNIATLKDRLNRRSQPVDVDLRPQNTSIQDNTDDFNTFIRTTMKKNLKSSTEPTTINRDNDLNEYNTGGSHQVNPLGGIPQGVGSNGRVNKVEENETSFELPQGKFIFSDKINLDDSGNTTRSIPIPVDNKFETGGPIDPKAFELNYINSPKYKERLQKSKYKDVEGEIDARANAVKNTNVIYQDGAPNFFEQIYNKFQDIPYTENGGSVYSNGTAIIDTEQANELNVGVDAIESHELAHPVADRINSADKQDLFYRHKKVKEASPRPILGSNRLSHDMRPKENKSDIDALRYLLKKDGIYDAGTQDFDAEVLERAKTNLKDKFILERLLQNYSDEDLIYIMNNIANVRNNNSNIRLA